MSEFARIGRHGHRFGREDLGDRGPSLVCPNLEAIDGLANDLRHRHVPARRLAGHLAITGFVDSR